MDKYWFVVVFFLIVVGLPVVFGVLGDVYKRRLKFKEREMELLGAQTAEKAAQYATHVAELEKRVRVLEQIATDDGLRLAREIDSLAIRQGGHA